MFTASVPLTPGATLVMTCPPASMPEVVMLGPSWMLTPSSVMLVLPTVRLSKLGSSLTAKVTFVSLCVSTMLLPAV